MFPTCIVSRGEMARIKPCGNTTSRSHASKPTSHMTAIWGGEIAHCAGASEHACGERHPRALSATQSTIKKLKERRDMKRKNTFILPFAPVELNRQGACSALIAASKPQSMTIEITLNRLMLSQFVEAATLSEGQPNKGLN